MDVGEHTTFSDGHTSQQLAELFIIADSKLDVAGHDTGLLVIAGSVTSKLKNFSCQVFENSSQVDGGTSTNAL